MSTSQFRYLLTASLIFGLAGAFFDSIFSSAVPEALSQAETALNAKVSVPMLIFTIAAALIGLVGYIAAIIGLFRFRSWAPRIAVSTTVVLILATPAIGADVSSGWASALTELSTTLWGVVLAVVYFSPIKEQFIATREHSMTVQELPIEKELAHPGKRFQGQFIDGLIAYFLGFIAYYLLDIFIGRESAVYSGIAIGVTYFLLSDSLPNGQSIGKKLLKIQVLSKDTMKPCSIFQSFLRNVTSPLSIFDWVPIFWGSHRRLGDFIASTIVVKMTGVSLTNPSSETR
jgi:uncharacterized RDD family membrane protein YckC